MKKIWILLLLTSFTFGFASEDKPLFMGVLILENDAMIPTFLEKINSLEYNKSRIEMHVDILNENPEVQAFVKEWCDLNSGNYGSITCEVSSSKPFEVQNGYLKNSKEAELLFMLSSKVFLKPFTLQILCEKNLPIIAPLLRPVPKIDNLRNFYVKANANGYFDSHPDHMILACRYLEGTYPVDSVSIAYLIKTEYVSQLSFNDNFKYDYVSFSNIARENQIQQYVCTEKEFGFFLHVEDETSLKDLIVPCLMQNITYDYIKQRVPATELDKSLIRYLNELSIDSYSLFPVKDQLYWIDEKWDFIKSNYLKKDLKWEENINEVFKKYVKPGDVVLDIGGHIGTHAINLSQLVGSKGAVHVFEPQAKLFTELLVNISVNQCSNVFPYHVALGSEEKEAEIVLPVKINEGMGHIGIGGESVRMKRLDDFQLDNVSFIKMDIEGYEVEALKGGLHTIIKNRPVMVIEILPTIQRKQTIEFIQNLGYEVTNIAAEDYLCLPL